MSKTKKAKGDAAAAPPAAGGGVQKPKVKKLSEGKKEAAVPIPAAAPAAAEAKGKKAKAKSEIDAIFSVAKPKAAGAGGAAAEELAPEVRELQERINKAREAEASKVRPGMRATAQHMRMGFASLGPPAPWATCLGHLLGPPPRDRPSTPPGGHTKPRGPSHSCSGRSPHPARPPTCPPPPDRRPLNP